MAENPTRTNGPETEVQWLKGVGPRIAMLLAKLGIKTVQELAWYFPRRYDDRRNLPPMMLLRPGQSATVRGRLAGIESRSTRGGKVMLRARIEDETGSCYLVWFNQPWIVRELKGARGEIIAFGLVREGSRHEMEISAPEWELIRDEDEVEDFARITPVYPLTEGVGQWVIRRAIRAVLDSNIQFADPLPPAVRERLRLPDLNWSIRQMHEPTSEQDRLKARNRLAFEEFLYLQLALQMRRNEVQQEVGIAFPISQITSAEGGVTNLFGAEGEHAAPARLWDQVHRMIPFELTGAQRRVIEEIWRDMERPAPMNRLVQGDVGSGKTAVAACAMLAAVRCGYQAALMAPTEILAEQHGINLQRLFQPLGIDVTLLVGKQTAAQKRKAMDAAQSGTAQVCIGTHALIQEGVTFQRLGLAVIDEQHRFGVMQRMALRQKGIGNPDVLVMTATPIPRTLTMSLYGDLDLSVIDELPPGRKPIRTHWKGPGERPQVYETVRKLVAEGAQAYFVCPMINESEKMQTQAAEDLAYRLSQDVFKDLRLGLLHGQLKKQEKEDVMERFRRHELDVLVSTVVIEVGVDVPNASIMVIEDANRFGLAQLHQLRGRVGRGGTQSFCILIADAKSPDAEQRLRIMTQTTDGFRIAEEDLKIRGPGDMSGTQQSGQLIFTVANLVDDAPLLERARQAAIEILETDHDLSQADHAAMLNRVRDRRANEAMIVVS